MKFAELTRLLTKAACYVVRENANHTIWYSSKIGKQFPVGRHQSEEVPAGTLKSIKRDARI